MCAVPPRNTYAEVAEALRRQIQASFTLPPELLRDPEAERRRDKRRERIARAKHLRLVRPDG